MLENVNAVVKTQTIIVEPTSGSVSVINSGPQGPPGIPGIPTFSGAIEFTEATPAGSPTANKAWLFVRDNGSGKTQLVVRFPTGATQVLATEP